MVDYLTLCFHRERRLVELRGPRWRAGRGVWGRWAAEELWVPWSFGRNQQRLWTNQWFQLLLPPLRQVTHFSSFWDGFEVLDILFFFSLTFLPVLNLGSRTHCVSRLTDSKASSTVSTNAVTAQNGSSSLSLLGAYSDSDSNDSEWEEDDMSDWHTVILAAQKGIWTLL